ncbi:hypothetical protein BAUCODRAFT_57460, partial [Baudoinia panamericana UAMH 10762]
MAPILQKRKRDTGQLEAISFDPTARQDYLTGFHKRKLARIQNARETAIKREKEEKVRERRQMREQRKMDLDRHMAEFNAELRKQNPDLTESEAEDGKVDADGAGGEWQGLGERPTADVAQEDEEYVDEDKYTTVTVEPMNNFNDEEDEDRDAAKEYAQLPPEDPNRSAKKKRVWAKDRPADGKARPKKHKFRYESKAERQETRRKQKVKRSKAAKAR